MLQTAETVAKRYQISKQAQDEYGVRSQLRAAAAQAAGKFKDEIAPMTTIMGVVDKATGAINTRETTIDADEGIRPDTTLEAVAKIRPALPGGASGPVRRSATTARSRHARPATGTASAARAHRERAAGR